MVTDWNAVRAQMQKEEKEAQDVRRWILKFVKGGASFSGVRDPGEWWNVIRRQSNAVLVSAFEDMTPDELATLFKACATAAHDALDMEHTRGFNEAWDECECDE